MDKLLQELYSDGHFAKIAKKLIEELSLHLKNTTSGKNQKTIAWETPENELNYWNEFLESGDKEAFFKEVVNRTIHTHHPKYMGHQVAATAPLTALSGMVSALLNNGMAVYEMGMAPSAIERIVTDSICQKIGYGKNSGGLLTSGGTLANLTALLSARKTIVEHDVWNEGQSEPLGIMVCEEAHYCIDRAAKIMGLGEKGIIKIPAQKDFSMDVSLLDKYYSESVSKGIEIFAIVGSAPSTATGAYDNLEALSEFAERKNIWFHVDGAHGGAAIYSRKYKHLLKGIERADSVVIDGHKMMLMPTITTALLYKNKSHAQQTFSQRADYLLDDTEEDQWYQSGKKTFECTKTMMSMHWFLLLKYYGEQIFDVFVTRQYNLARDFASLLKQHPSFELAIEPASNILCFRYVPEKMNDSKLNSLNTRIRQSILRDGEFYLVQTKLRGIQYLRTTLMNAFTTKEHLEALLEKLEKVGSHLK